MVRRSEEGLGWLGGVRRVGVVRRSEEGLEWLGGVRRGWSG